MVLRGLLGAAASRVNARLASVAAGCWGPLQDAKQQMVAAETATKHRLSSRTRKVATRQQVIIQLLQMFN